MSWLLRRKTAAPSTPPLDLELEAKNVDQAVNGALLIMNDDLDGAENALKQGDSTFHELARGAVTFVRALLGLEKDVMKEASDRLAAAEKSATNDYDKMSRWLASCDPKDVPSTGIYPPDTAYLLSQAMAQFMGAGVGAMNESVTEAAIAFYKLNRAYSSFDRIMKLEEEFVRKRRQQQQQHSGNKGATSRPTSSVLRGPTSDITNIATQKRQSTEYDTIDHDPGSDIFTTSFDALIHSGANMCFGALMLCLTIIPPTFAKLLAIVGFHGDRERGLRMLWQASKFSNMLGAMAGLVLLLFYNGIIRYADIIPDLHGDPTKDITTYPARRLHDLLNLMRSNLPDSQLWLLEMARMRALDKHLDEACEILTACDASSLRQVEALHAFELSLDAMFAHKYTLSAETFIRCVDINSWSQSLYFYAAASCHVCLYRQTTDKTLAEKYASRAMELYEQVPVYIGKKKLFGTQLPFDVFVLRKYHKFHHRARKMNKRLVDAIGVDPIEELNLLFNGHVRMNETQLKDGLARLSWSDERAENAHDWAIESQDEKALLALVRAGIHRHLRHHELAQSLLKTEILDKPEPHDSYHEDWVRPVTYYELACNAWMQRTAYRGIESVSDKGATSPSPQPPQNGFGATGGKHYAAPRSVDLEHDRSKVAECRHNLEKIASWRQYELHARFGIRVTIGLSTVARWEAEHAQKV